MALQAAKLEAEVLATRDDATLIQLLNLIDQAHRQHGFEVAEEDIDLDEFRADYHTKIPVLERVIQTWEEMGNACASVLEGISPEEWESVRYALLTSHKEALIYAGMTQKEIHERIEFGKIIVEGWGLEAFNGYDVFGENLRGFFGRRLALIEAVLEAVEWEVCRTDNDISL